MMRPRWRRARVTWDRSLPLDGPASFVLHARPQDDGAMWPALAARCRQALPTRLQWATVLLDPADPRPVTCAEAQVRELFHWLDGQPNTERVSIACERRTPTGHPAEHDATPRPEITDYVAPPGLRLVATYDPVGDPRLAAA